MGFNQQNCGFNGIYPLVNVYMANWKVTIFNGKIHYKWAIFNSYVKLSEGNWVVVGPKRSFLCKTY